MIGPVPMAPYFATGIPSSYIVCEDDQAPVAGVPNWHPYFSSRLKNPTLKFVKSGHEVMFTHPVECARALHELAKEVASATVKEIRAAGFAVIRDSTKRFANHGRIIHPDGLMGFTETNIEQLAQAFAEKVI